MAVGFCSLLEGFKLSSLGAPSKTPENPQKISCKDILSSLGDGVERKFFVVPLNLLTRSPSLKLTFFERKFCTKFGIPFPIISPFKLALQNDNFKRNFNP